MREWSQMIRKFHVLLREADVHMNHQLEAYSIVIKDNSFKSCAADR